MSREDIAGREGSEPIVVPHTELSPDSLQALIESFVLREGTDYGETELSLQQKVAGVLRQLERGEAQIVFDPASASVTITPRRGSGFGTPLAHSS